MPEPEDTKKTLSEQQKLQQIVREMEIKLAKALRERSVYSTKSRLLAEELEQYRQRELRQDGTVEQLIERQHELNVMLNRSNIMLAKAQDAAAMLSLEFGELARALPEPPPDAPVSEIVDIESRVSRINNLFKQSGKLSEEIAETLSESKEAQKRAEKPTDSGGFNWRKTEESRPDPKQEEPVPKETDQAPDQFLGTPNHPVPEEKPFLHIATDEGNTASQALEEATDPQEEQQTKDVDPENSGAWWRRFFGGATQEK